VSRFLTAHEHIKHNKHKHKHINTVSFTLVRAGKYSTDYWRQVKNTDNTQTKHNPEKTNNAKHSKNKTTRVRPICPSRFKY